MMDESTRLLTKPSQFVYATSTSSIRKVTGSSGFDLPSRPQHTCSFLPGVGGGPSVSGHTTFNIRKRVHILNALGI